ncbi:MAG: DUF1573 domain-containing protein [Verrucomicrobiota bacterium]|jgi:hypothetical protein|nr:DUF1573 domain-containing protein [Verrucomicrobiota bacterium]
MKAIYILLASFLVFFPAAFLTAGEGDAAIVAPKIVCAEPVYDFGERSNTEIVEHAYPIQNDGTLSLEIKSVRASCGCTAVKPSRDVIAPGEKAWIETRFDLRGRTGQQVKIITVESNDPQSPVLRLQIKGVALQKLRAQPSNIFFGRISKDSPRHRSFDVISEAGPIQILSYRTDHPSLSITQVESPETDGSQHRFDLRLADDLPEGNLSGTIYVKTDMPGQGDVRITVHAFIPAENR